LTAAALGRAIEDFQQKTTELSLIEKTTIDPIGRRAMKVTSTVLTIALLLFGCSQLNEQFYSKKTFNSQSFDADIAECKHHNPSFMALQGPPADQKARADDAMVRECMKAKGYTIETEPAWSH
jgi:hypothetical protein